MTPRPRPAEPVLNEALPKVAALLGGNAAGLAVTAASDLSLIVDADGVIQGASGAADFAEEKIGGWLGRRLVDTVTVESRTKVDELLRDAGPGEITRWRQVNHPSPTGIDLPIRYTALRPDADGPILVLGRDMRTVAALQRRLADTQQTLERDYDRLRAAETRYRLLFQICGEAVLVVDSTTRRVIEANPAAARLLGRAVRRLVGVDVVELFDQASLRTLEAQHGSLRSTGQAADIRAALPQGRGEVTISASLFRGEGGTSAILRLIPEPGMAGTGPGESTGTLPTRALIESMPEGFVVTDSGHRVLWANAAFLELAQLAAEGQARGRPIEEWLARDETEARTLFATLQDHGSVRRFASVVRGTYGGIEDVEIAAVSLPSSPAYIGLSIRALPPRSALNVGTRAEPRSVEQMAELVGRVSMKTLVRETTDLIEKLCIEAALRITRDNRASAAEMLGLSRQGLYAKMRRYGVGDLSPGDEA
ncbi:transcriptional regulator PpsR [Methylobacterium komagatae]|uniref:Transcriptional regulator PpsR n=1 Tax=Methylobacterium komagatae TaxID=374425 RepID=A0ABW2BMU2_9HYPH